MDTEIAYTVNRQAILETIKRSGMSITAVCKAMGIARSTLYRKLDGKLYFTTREITDLYRLLPCDPLTFITYFFTLDVA